MVTLPDNRPPRILLNPKIKVGSQTDTPEHTDRVLLKPYIRVADTADESCFEIPPSSHVIDHGIVSNVVVEGINRKVSTEGVFHRSAEGIVSLDEEALTLFANLLFLLRLLAKGRDLDYLASLEHDMGDLEPSSHESAVGKDLFQPSGLGVGCHIEVAGVLGQKEIPHSAAAQVGDVPGAPQTVENLQHLLRHELPGDKVLIARYDYWFHETSAARAGMPFLIIDFPQRIKGIPRDGRWTPSFAGRCALTGGPPRRQNPLTGRDE
jgi:hypothetical protein